MPFCNKRAPGTRQGLRLVIIALDQIARPRVVWFRAGWLFHQSAGPFLCRWFDYMPLSVAVNSNE